MRPKRFSGFACRLGIDPAANSRLRTCKIVAGERFLDRDALDSFRSIHVRNPDGHEILTFVRDGLMAGGSGGVLHFGFRLKRSQDIDAAVLEIEQAGGKILFAARLRLVG